MSLSEMTFMGATGTMTGNHVRVDGFPGAARTKHVVSITAVNLKAQLVIEGTLLEQPGDDDWFPITEMSFETQGQETRGYGFKSRTVWLRVRLDNVESGYVRRAIVR